jgi:predicted nucleotidyltransferase
MLNPDFREMLSCLKDEGVEFIVVGAYALAAHGLPRATGDIDIWVRNSRENARRVLGALSKFGAPVSELSEDDFTSSDMIVQFGVEPCRIDFLTGIDGVVFDDAWANKLSVNVDGLDIHVLSKEDLIKNKRAAGREKDSGDVVWLEKNPAGEG